MGTDKIDGAGCVSVGAHEPDVDIAVMRQRAALPDKTEKRAGCKEGLEPAAFEYAHKLYERGKSAGRRKGWPDRGGLSGSLWQRKRLMTGRGFELSNGIINAGHQRLCERVVFRAV